MQIRPFREKWIILIFHSSNGNMIEAESTWEVVRIQQSRFCEFPASKKFPNDDWYIKMIQETVEAEIKNDVKILIFRMCFVGLWHRIQEEENGYRALIQENFFHDWSSLMTTRIYLIRGLGQAWPDLRASPAKPGRAGLSFRAAPTWPGLLKCQTPRAGLRAKPGPSPSTGWYLPAPR